MKEISRRGFEEKIIAVTRLTLANNQHQLVIEVTPNHPMPNASGKMNAGVVPIGAIIHCYNAQQGRFMPYTVVEKTEFARGKQKVYNIETDEGETLVVNDVIVLQK